MAGTPNYIQMPPNSTGVKVQTWENSLSQGTVDTEAVVITDSTGIEKATSGNPLRIDPVGTTVQPVDGALTNNNAAPTTTLLGTIDAIANAANPSWSEGNQVLQSVDLSGNLRVKVNAALPAGTNVIGHVIVDSGSITANAGTNLNTSALALDTSVNGILVAQASTTSGQTGPLVQTATTTGAPTYTTAKTNPLSTDTAGNLRVSVLNTPAVTGSGVFEVGPTTSANTLSNQFFVQLSDGTHGNTFNSTTYTSKYGADVNILGTLGTAFTTAGFVDIKGADGNVFVRQATAANLNATVVGTGTFAVQAAQSGNWTSRIVGNGGATLDFAQGGATAPTNALAVGGVYNSSLPTLTNGQAGAFQTDSSGRLIVNVGAGSSGNAAASATGSAVPADADYLGVNISGTLRGVTGVNLSGSIYAAQTDLSSVGGTSISLGQAVAASCIPVVLPSGTNVPVTGTITAVTSITNALPAGTNTLGAVSEVPTTAGGCSVYHVVSAGSTNQASIKASPGQIYGWNIYSAAAYPVYIKFYNTAGTPTAGTSVIQTVGIQAGTSRELWVATGIPYATGIGISITKGIADSDATAVLANDAVVEVFYK